MIKNPFGWYGRNGCGQTVHLIPKLTVSQERIGGINWLFCMNWADFLHGDCDAITLYEHR